jgi:hypothetical protein
MIKKLYSEDEFFSKMKAECAKRSYKEFMVKDEYLFYGKYLCILNYSLQ